MFDRQTFACPGLPYTGSATAPEVCVWLYAAPRPCQEYADG